MNKSNKKTTHVVPDPNGGWNIKQGGKNKPISHHNNKNDAIDRARKISRDEKSELFIHGKDGKFQRKDSHGGDPFPPKG